MNCSHILKKTVKEGNPVTDQSALAFFPHYKYLNIVCALLTLEFFLWLVISLVKIWHIHRVLTTLGVDKMLFWKPFFVISRVWFEFTVNETVSELFYWQT